MEKFLEKKNLGMPVTLLALLAYVIGYYMTNNFSGLLVAVVFGVIVFAFDFEDAVKTTVKQSYTIAVLFDLIYLVLGILFQLSNMVSGISYIFPGSLYSLANSFYLFLSSVVNIAVIVVFALMLLFILLKKDIKLDFILHILGEGKPKAQPVPPVYQQPVQPVPQQMPSPVPPTAQQGNNVSQPVSEVICPKCHTANKPGDLFCSSCGTKL